MDDCAALRAAGSVEDRVVTVEMAEVLIAAVVKYRRPMYVELMDKQHHAIFVVFGFLLFSYKRIG